jgi:hypothetical protein
MLCCLSMHQMNHVFLYSLRETGSRKSRPDFQHCQLREEQWNLYIYCTVTIISDTQITLHVHLRSICTTPKPVAGLVLATRRLISNGDESGLFLQYRVKEGESDESKN